MRVLFLLLLCAACGTVPKRNREPLPAPVTVPLTEYMKTDLRTVQVSLGGKDYAFLFDTGSGVTVISPELATLAGCTPAGRLTAHRMSGERIDAPRCAGVSLSLGGVALKSDTIVLDVGALLPKEWDRVHGVISLATLQDLPFTLAFAKRELVLETPSSLAQRTAAMRSLPFRLARPAGGDALDIFVKVDAKPQPLWMILDSGNVAPVVIAPHAAQMLGLAGQKGDVQLAVDGIGAPVTLPAVVSDIIYDGNLGTSLISRATLSADLSMQQLWISTP